MSYSTVQLPFTFEWSRWFSHRSRHVFGARKRALFVCMNKLRETSFHLRPNSLHLTPNTCIPTAVPDCSQQQGLLLLVPARLFRTAYHD